VRESASAGVSPEVSVEVWGTGKPMREFLWSEDMADACVFLMERVNFVDLKGTSGERGEVRNTHINIGTGREVSIRDLARMIADTVGFRGSLAFDATKPDGTMRKLTDPSKLHSLGWRHKVDLEEGLRLMYGHYLEG
jgi:GDP-L-fucose synthase